MSVKPGDKVSFGKHVCDMTQNLTKGKKYEVLSVDDRFDSVTVINDAGGTTTVQSKK
jgi:hypothetical protein